VRNRVTLEDVARHAGVSRATASLVVRKTGRVSQATRDRVLNVMSELGYVHHHGAAALVTKKSGTVGILVTTIGSPYWGELIQGMQAELQAAGHLVLLADTGDDPVRQRESVEELLRHQVAGVAVIPATGTDRSFVEQLERWDLPYVLMARDLKEERAVYVGPDDVRGGQLAAEHLLAHGCRRIAYVGGPPTVMSRWDRIAGVRKALAGHPGAELIEICSETSGEGGRRVGLQLVDSDDGLPDGVICHNDTVAFGLYRALRTKGAGGIRVIGYDDIGSAALWEPPLTSVSTAGKSLGRLAAATLLKRVANAGQSPTRSLTEPTLVIRESCGCPPRNMS
jgi:LacI family transcriptional regulator